MQAGDARCREIQHLVELVAPKRVAFGGALHLDEGAAAVHDHVHVGLGIGVLGVVQVEHRSAAVDAHGHRRHLAVQRIRADGAPLEQSVHGIRQARRSRR